VGEIGGMGGAGGTYAAIGSCCVLRGMSALEKSGRDAIGVETDGDVCG
jgi:hypothetical protein